MYISFVLYTEISSSLRLSFSWKREWILGPTPSKKADLESGTWINQSYHATGVTHSLHRSMEMLPEYSHHMKNRELCPDLTSRRCCPWELYRSRLGHRIGWYFWCLLRPCWHVGLILLHLFNGDWLLPTMASYLSIKIYGEYVLGSLFPSIVAKQIKADAMFDKYGYVWKSCTLETSAFREKSVWPPFATKI